KSGRRGPYRQASPRRPGTAPALGLRAGNVVATIIEQTILTKEIPMWFRTLFDSMKQRRSGTPARRTPRRPTTTRLRVEALDDRCLPSTFTVTNLLDTGAGSLRAAVAAANANPGADAIDFATAGTIALTSGELDITDSLTINGPGESALTVSGA